MQQITKEKGVGIDRSVALCTVDVDAVCAAFVVDRTIVVDIVGIVIDCTVVDVIITVVLSVPVE